MDTHIDYLLRAAEVCGDPVQIFRQEHTDDFLSARVLSYGAELTLIANISHGLRHDGYSLIRTQDVTEIDNDPERGRFVTSVMRARHERETSCKLDPPDNFQQAFAGLLKLKEFYPLLTFETETYGETGFEVAELHEAGHTAAACRCIDSVAVWEDAPVDIPYHEIRTLGFGGDYEEALYLVARD